MEIEGLINHTLASAILERNFIAQRMVANKEHITFWNSVKKIHTNEDIRSKLENITHIRQILGSEEYMEYMIQQDPEDPLEYLGIPLKTIEFYIHLRDSLETKTIF